MTADAARAGFAPAKINLTLSVHGRRADGYHEIESLVAFAAIGDRLSLTPGNALGLDVSGQFAADAGPIADNLVIQGIRNLQKLIPELRTGHFVLIKNLPAAAGLGGGSSDAAAALRLITHLNGFELSDERVIAAARATGADVPVCLDPVTRVMTGIGDVLSPPGKIPRTATLIVNPRVHCPTSAVFAALGLKPNERVTSSMSAAELDLNRTDFYAFLQSRENDLERAAIELTPIIAVVLSELRALSNCRLARMSGSGATCFALFDSEQSAHAGAIELQRSHPNWWIALTTIGGDFPHPEEPPVGWRLEG